MLTKKSWPYQISVICIIMWYYVYTALEQRKDKGQSPTGAAVAGCKAKFPALKQLSAMIQK